MPVRLKHALVLLVLVAMVLGGAAWGWAALTKPFPKLTSDDTPDSPCTEVTLGADSPVRPAMVWVSVLNASTRNGLAGVTLTALVEKGFGEGTSGNAPSGTSVDRAEIWTGDVTSPAAALLQTYLGPDTEIVEHPELGSRVTVVVGQDFKELRKGKRLVTATGEATICSPPETDTTTT